MDKEKESRQKPRMEMAAQRIGGVFTLEGIINGEDVYLAIAPITNGISTEDLLRKLNGSRPVVHRNYYGQELLISHSPSFKLHPTLRISESAKLGSDTEYAGRTVNKEVALQVVRRLKKSKPPHGHDDSEFYHHISGELAIRMMNTDNGHIDEEILSDSNPVVEVPTGFVHQVKSIGGVAISVLECKFSKHDYYPELSLFS